LFNTEKKRFSAIRKEKRKLERNLLKLDRTVFELDEISASKDNELFVNLGNGVYLESKAIDKKKVKFSVGANVFLDKSITDVVKTLKKKKRKIRNQS
jgi:prefoldin subunit 5